MKNNMNRRGGLFFARRKCLFTKRNLLQSYHGRSHWKNWGCDPYSKRYLGILEGTHCFAAYLPNETEPPANMTFLGLRSLFGELNEHLYGVAVRALSIINWDNTHQFCSQCGSRAEKEAISLPGNAPHVVSPCFPAFLLPLLSLSSEAKRCFLPARAGLRKRLYSVIAGFVEPGESLEETVRREIKEETGIEVKNIRYFGSQPWPFPDSLMIGFTARYAGGEIKVDGEEIVEAKWFAADQLPNIPGKISIARSLIDWFVAKHVKDRA